MIKTKQKVTQRELQSLESGLKIDNTIQITYPKDKSIVNIIFLLIISFLGLFGTVLSFVTLFSIPINMGHLLLSGTLFFAIFSLISLLPDKFIVSIIPILLFYIYLIKDYIDDLSLGYQIIANSIASSVHSIGVWTKYYDIPTDIIMSDYSTTFLLFSMFLLSCLICLFTIKFQSCIVGFAITFPFIECGLYFGLVPDYTSFFMVVCYWIALLSMALSGYKKTNKNKTAGFVRIGNSFYAKCNKNFQISEKIGIYSIILCMICAMLSSIFVSVSNYERSTKIDDIRTNIKDSIEDFSLENAPDMLSRLGSLLNPGNNGSFNGTLGQKDTIQYDNVEKLSIKSTAEPKNDIYLKGYIGSKYTGQSWDKLDNQTYKNQLFDTFKQNTLYPQDVSYALLNNTSYDKYTLTISPVKKNLRTTFIPYFSRILNDYSYTNDTLIQSQNRDTYSFEIINIPYNDIYNNSALSSSSGLVLTTNDISFDNNGYSEFVKENYLQLDTNDKMNNVKNIFNSYLNKFGTDFDTFKATSSTSEKIFMIRDFLCYNYDYTLSPGKTPIGEDYVEYFLTQMDKGFCSHFASAGTILCRMLDIPSRYAEGYYVSKDKFNTSNFNGDTYTVSVEDNLAHAWTEIYIDNLGWITYDFTPGFNNNPTKESLLNSPNVPEDTPQEQQTEEVTQPVQSEFTENPSSEITTEPMPSPNSPQITTTTSNDNSQNNIEQNKIDKRTLKTIKNIVIFILIIAFIVLATIYRRKYILKNRGNSLSNQDDRISILSAYKYSISLLSFIGIKQDSNTQHLEFARKVEHDLKYAKNFVKVMEITLKLDLSNDKITTKEKSFVIDFVNNLATSIYQRQNKIGKFIMKYILCLI